MLKGWKVAIGWGIWVGLSTLAYAAPAIERDCWDSISKPFVNTFTKPYLSITATISLPFLILSSSTQCAGELFVFQEQLRFLEASREQLHAEMGQGAGEHLEALASLHGCPTHAWSHFAQMTQTRYERFIQTSPTDEMFLVALHQEIGNNSTLAEQCTMKLTF